MLAASLFLCACGRFERAYVMEAEVALAENPRIPLDRAYVSSRAPELAGRTLQVDVRPIAETVAAGRRAREDRDFEGFALDFEQALAEALWRTRVFRDVGRAKERLPIADPDVILTVSITEWHEGHAALRWLIGFGAGAARVQTEGAFVDARDGHVYAAFADRRAHPGGGWFSLRTFAPQALIAEELFRFTRGLQRTVSELTGRPPPRGGYDRVVLPRPSRRSAEDATSGGATSGRADPPAAAD